ncbi:MAG: M15 family metallopeptidase [Bacteroidales bacterium]
MVKYIYLSFIAGICISCTTNQSTKHQNNTAVDSIISDTINQKDTVAHKKTIHIDTLSDTSFVNINHYLPDIALNFVYADTTNFFETAVYPCEECLLRKEVAEAVVKVNDYLDSLGYTLQLMDCYRPLSVQKYMWDVLPDGRYVANPHRGGSIHNRGGAVDARLLYKNGDTVPMGTEFDHFGEKAAHSYTHLPDSILQNRKTLKNAMERFGFQHLRTEWWHYSYHKARSYPIAQIDFSCK